MKTTQKNNASVGYVEYKPFYDDDEMTTAEYKKSYTHWLECVEFNGEDNE